MNHEVGVSDHPKPHKFCKKKKKRMEQQQQQGELFPETTHKPPTLVSPHDPYHSTTSSDLNRQIDQLLEAGVDQTAMAVDQQKPMASSDQMVNAGLNQVFDGCVFRWG